MTNVKRCNTCLIWWSAAGLYTGGLFIICWQWASSSVTQPSTAMKDTQTLGANCSLWKALLTICSLKVEPFMPLPRATLEYGMCNLGPRLDNVWNKGSFFLNVNCFISDASLFPCYQNVQVAAKKQPQKLLLGQHFPTTVQPHQTWLDRKLCCLDCNFLALCQLLYHLLKP